jgi:acyl-CoA synthetase (AMP-forming)/AMP-acid ligase II
MTFAPGFQHLVLGAGAQPSGQHRAGRAGADAITAFCRERLASYKVPARLAFRAAGDFPRTATGKIHKPGLRQELATDGTS